MSDREVDELDPADAAIEAEAKALANRAEVREWILALSKIANDRSTTLDRSARVQFAYDMMHIAVCERATRLLNSDISSEGK